MGDTEEIRRELKRLQDRAAADCAEAAAARERRAAAERKIQEDTDQAAEELARFQKYHKYGQDLVNEISTARQVITEIREECLEERRQCSGAVELLDQEQRRTSRCHRGSSPIPDSTLADLTQQLEVCMQRARTLEEENELIRNHRRREADHCRDAVEHLRSRVRRYRARCDELRNNGTSCEDETE